MPTDFAITFDLTVSIFMAAIFLLLGRVVSARPVSEDAHLAKLGFAWWWYGLGAITLAGVGLTIAYRQGQLSLPFMEAYTQTVFTGIVFALAGLMYYFTYLLTGKRQSWKPVAAFYIVFLFTLSYYIAASNPIGIEEAANGGPTMTYAQDLTDEPATAILGLLLLLPILIGAIGYFALIRKVPERSGKFRIASVGGAFILWFGSSLLADQVLNLTEAEWWRYASRLITLMASFMVYVAFRPPQWVQTMFGIHGYDASREGADAAK